MFGVPFLFVLESWKVKNVRLLFAELLRH